MKSGTKQTNEVSASADCGMNRLVFGGDSLGELRDSLLSSSPLESAAFVLARPALTESGAWRLVAFKTIFVDSDEYVVQTESRIELAPDTLARALTLARAEEASLVLVHSHPLEDYPTPSGVDLEGEALLLPAIRRRVNAVPHARLIVGRKQMHSALFAPHGEVLELVTQQAGKHVLVFGQPSDEGQVDTIFDRQVRALGREGQELLGRLRVGIVGLGGTGSHVAQQLAHLGVQRFLLIDHDSIDVTSLNRVIGSSPANVGEAKVLVAKRQISSIAQSAEIEALQQDIMQNATAMKLLDVDFVFACTDSHGTRAVLNQLSYQYSVPMIDSGLAIQAQAGMVSHISGRVQMLAPGLACLSCADVLDPEEVRRDLLSPAERFSDPYIVGEAVPQPSVVSINGTAAAFAVTMFLAAVTGLPNGERHQIMRLERGHVTPVSVSPQTDCPICGPGGALQRSNTWTPPGRLS